MFQVSVKDDNDLEFDHGFLAEVVGGADLGADGIFGRADGIILPIPVHINITDDGMCACQSFTRSLLLH